jgi:DNA-directed RNA polymerase subunit F
MKYLISPSLFMKKFIIHNLQFIIFPYLCHKKNIMAEFGDWIYILIIAIAGIFSLIGSTRKKARQMAEANQQQQPQQPREIIADPGSEGGFWDDFIPKAEEKPVMAGKKKRDVSPSYSSSGKQNKPFLNRFQEGHPSRALETVEESSPINAAEEEYASITIDDIPKEANEWRTVFIYNEIFSRKN